MKRYVRLVLIFGILFFIGAGCIMGATGRSSKNPSVADEAAAEAIPVVKSGSKWIPAKETTLPVKETAHPAKETALPAKQAEVKQEVVQGPEAAGGKSELVYLSVKNAAASSFDDTPDWAPPPDPMAPVDGNMVTRWSSKLGLDNEWIYFDFGRPKTLSKIIIRWEAAFAPEYRILISDDAEDWKEVIFTRDNLDGGVDEHTFKQVVARYVKLVGLKRDNPSWGFSMWEFEMYGPAESNPDDKILEKDYLARQAKGEEEIEKHLTENKTVTETPKSGGASRFHKGIVYTSWKREELSGNASDFTLIYLDKLGVDCAGIMIVWFQDDLMSETIYPETDELGDTPSDESLAHAISMMHQLGWKVLLKPHVEVQDGSFRGEIYPTAKWFQSYKNYILYYAKLARANNVDIFCIGTELKGATRGVFEKNWRDLIAKVKEIYNGKLTYAANWDEYENVPFWDQMDYVGMDAYFMLTDKKDPTKEELVAAWDSYANRIEEWLKSKSINKQVIFTEIGYGSFDGANMEPWLFPSQVKDRELVKDEQEQADCIDALLTSLTKRQWFGGFYWWNYFPQERWSPLGHNLRGKLGEKILSEWYKKLE